MLTGSVILGVELYVFQSHCMKRANKRKGEYYEEVSATSKDNEVKQDVFNPRQEEREGTILHENLFEWFARFVKSNSDDSS